LLACDTFAADDRVPHDLAVAPLNLDGALELMHPDVDWPNGGANVTRPRRAGSNADSGTAMKASSGLPKAAAVTSAIAA
jgi:hypothetical protein